jgi:hypothetical protein
MPKEDFFVIHVSADNHYKLFINKKINLLSKIAVSFVLKGITFPLKEGKMPL